MPRPLISTQNETVPIARGGWLDALRFIAAFLIVLHHFEAAGPMPLAEAVHPAFARSGFLLTNFFLIDSGYVLMRVYAAAVETGRLSGRGFFLRRVLRVAPAHLIMGLGLAALVGLAALAGVAPRNPEWFAWDQLPAQLLLLQAYGVHGGLGWNAPTWSISALIGCYLCFPWIVRGLMRVGPWGALAGGVLGYLAVNQLCWSLLGYPVYQMPMGYGVIRGLALFVLGLCLAAFARRVRIDPRLAAWTGAAAAAALITAQALDKNALFSLAMIALIILAAGAQPVTRPSRVVETAAVASFALFITNEVVRIVWFGVVNILIDRLTLSLTVQWALWGAGVAAAVVFAFAFHVFIDRPIQARVQAWLKRTRPSRPAPAHPGTDGADQRLINVPKGLNSNI